MLDCKTLWGGEHHDFLRGDIKPVAPNSGPLQKLAHDAIELNFALGLQIQGQLNIHNEATVALALAILLLQQPTVHLHILRYRVWAEQIGRAGTLQVRRPCACSGPAHGASKGCAAS